MERDNWRDANDRNDDWTSRERNDVRRHGSDGPRGSDHGSRACPVGPDMAVTIRDATDRGMAPAMAAT